MYTLHDYAAMIYDTRRVEAYRRALQLVVNSDSVVVDIGTGLGIFAFLASQAGARKVYAIEPREVIAVARELAQINGYIDRIEFIENVSSHATLSEQADVIVSDLGGAIPLYAQHLPSIMDARKRLLKPHGALIPKRDILWVGVVNAAALHAKIAPSTDRALGLDMRLAWNMAANRSSNKGFSELLTAAQRMAILDYFEVEDPNVHRQITWHTTRAGTGHGIGVWFDRILADGVYFSTAPSEPDTVYGRVFFPWPEPVELEETDTIHLDLRANFQGNDYVWNWNTTVFSGAMEKRKFRQSTFFGEPRSPARMRKRRATHVPRLNADGESDRLILHLMNGKNAIQDIARELQRRSPSEFPSLEDAIWYVGGLSVKYSL
jgi:protein arginine N-methyltransferase 1